MELATESELTITVFVLNNEAYGVDTHVVSEIARLQDVAPVPHTPPYLDGVINLRGRIIPVVDLRARFGMPRVAAGGATRIVIVELDGNQVGLVVDAVSEIRTIHTGDIDETVLGASEIDGSFVRGILNLPERLIIMLDLHATFADRLGHQAA